MAVFTGFADVEGGSGEVGATYAMPAHASTLTKALPAYVSPGDTGDAFAWCTYTSAGDPQVGPVAMYAYARRRYTVQP